MASGAAPCSDQRSSATDWDKPPPPPPPVHGRGRKWTGGVGHCEICVVCGDRACNHHYYGVAACRGCKCFFWRSIKNKLKYICRGDGHCEINPNHRNACRFCRLQRCLKAGMQPEAVRMPKEGNDPTEAEMAKLEQSLMKGGKKKEEMEGHMKKKNKWEKEAADVHCPLCHQHCPTEKIDGVMEAATGEHKHRQNHYQQMNGISSMDTVEKVGKNSGEMCTVLVRKLVEIETNINEVADFSENEAPKHQLGLESLFLYPEFLDRFRTQVNYCVRLRRVTEEEMEFCKYRTLTKVVDYIRSLSMLEPILTETEENQDKCGSSTRSGEWLSVQDKIVLLRHSFAPLALFDIASGTSFTTKDTQNLLCLPTGLTVCANEDIVPNGFLSQQIVSRCISSLVRVLTELALDQEEFVMVKLIIVLAMDSAGDATGPEGGHYPPSPASGKMLSASGQQFVECLRDKVHSALYNHSPKRAPSSSSSSSSSGSSSSSPSSDAAIRFAKLLHILPKLMLLSRDLVEHIRMVHTFPTAHSRPTDPLFFQMFGDIFNEIQGRPASSSSSSFGNSPSALPISPATTVPNSSLISSSIAPFKAELGSPGAVPAHSSRNRVHLLPSPSRPPHHHHCPSPASNNCDILSTTGDAVADSVASSVMRSIDDEFGN